MSPLVLALLFQEGYCTLDTDACIVQTRCLFSLEATRQEQEANVLLSCIFHLSRKRIQRKLA